MGRVVSASCAALAGRSLGTRSLSRWLNLTNFARPMSGACSFAVCEPLVEDALEPPVFGQTLHQHFSLAVLLRVDALCDLGSGRFSRASSRLISG